MIKTPLSTVIGGAFWTPSATILGSSSKNLSQLIKSLFSLGEQGFAYDPNDLTTLYQDAAGTIPVTAAGQPVGLMKDKSKGLVLGGEISKPFTNSEWGFSEGITVEDDLLHFTNAINGASALCANLAIVSGRFYVLEFDYVSYTSGGGVYARVNSGEFTAIPTNTSGHKKVILRAETSGDSIHLAEGVGGGNYTIGNVSLKELVGNHAHQTQSAMRPLLVANPQRLDYDTVDDKLITTLPAQLTGCTVVRSVPNVGAQILTNQTIPTPYNDNIDNCGLIVINRALTPIETAQITQVFNKLAGV